MIFILTWIAYHLDIFLGIFVMWIFARIFKQVAFDVIQGWNFWENSKMDLKERTIRLDIIKRQAVLELQKNRMALLGSSDLEQSV